MEIILITTMPDFSIDLFQVLTPSAGAQNLPTAVGILGDNYLLLQKGVFSDIYDRQSRKENNQHSDIVIYEFFYSLITFIGAKIRLFLQLLVP